MDLERGSERELLDGHLDHNRNEVRRRVTGLSWDLATTRLGPTPTSAAGIVKHLIDVERWWFRYNLPGEAGVAFNWSAELPDEEFGLTEDDSLESLLAEYDLACAESRAASAQLDLAEQCVIADPHGGRPSLRWVFLHMIEETARHNGHLDIYRELLDGATDHQ